MHTYEIFSLSGGFRIGKARARTPEGALSAWARAQGFPSANAVELSTHVEVRRTVKEA